jgi:Tol biopolymer transport system component/DNA-binding winged helix-turn-helix (wHTH) protein
MTPQVANYQFDDIEVRPRSFEVLKAGRVLPLEPKSIRVQLHLIGNRDRAVSKEEIFRSVWPDTAVTDNALTRVIAQLRRELGDDARQPRYIQTVPTLGYRFIGRLDDEPAPAASDRLPQPRRLTWVAAGAVASVVLTAAAFMLSSHSPGSAVFKNTTQITTSSGFDGSPAFSPDGKWIAYTSDRSGSFEIYLRAASGGALDTPLTSDGAQNVQAAWSPDGKWIAYHSVANGGIWVIPAAGGTPRRITRSGSQPAWSPDSRQIAFRSENVTSLAATDIVSGTRSFICVVSAEGGEPATIVSTSPPGVKAFPAWHPRTRRLLFASLSAKSGELWTVNADGSRPLRLLTAESSVFFSPVYSPSGDRIVYGSFSRTREFGLQQVRLKDGGDAVDGEPELLTRSGTLILRDLAISPDGRRLLYTSASASSTFWQLATGADGQPLGEPAPFYQDVVFRMSFPSFSPDGRHIAFFARLFGGQGNIWTMKSDGTGATQLTDSPGFNMMPGWTADSSAIVYSRTTDGTEGVHLWRKSVADRSERPFSQDRRPHAWSRLTPAGNELIYHRLDGGIFNIWSKQVASGIEKQLTHDSEGAGFPAVSLDGKLISYQLLRGPDNYLGVMNHDGSGQVQLNQDRGLSWAFSWSPDHSRILFAGQRNGTWDLWWIDTRTREQRKLTAYRSIATFVRYPAWSPRGDRIVFERSITRGNIYSTDLTE